MILLMLDVDLANNAHLLCTLLNLQVRKQVRLHSPTLTSQKYESCRNSLYPWLLFFFFFDISFKKALSKLQKGQT